MTPSSVAKKIGLPVAEWPGRCHEVAALCLVAGVTTGSLRYGLWHGPVKGKRGGFPVHHGWVEVDPSTQDAWDIAVCEICSHVQDEHRRNGLLNACEIDCCGCEDFVRKVGGARVFDPTRFVFEDTAPYLFDEEDEYGYYDVAGDRERARRVQKYSDPPRGKRRSLVTLALESTSTRLAIMEVLGRDETARKLVKHAGDGIRLPSSVAAWLAVQPVSEFGPFAEDLYRALDAAGLKSAIPIDCRELVFGDGFYGKRAEYEAMIASVRKSVTA